jgi:hypothetical protein
MWMWMWMFLGVLYVYMQFLPRYKSKDEFTKVKKLDALVGVENALPILFPDMPEQHEFKDVTWRVRAGDADESESEEDGEWESDSDYSEGHVRKPRKKKNAFAARQQRTGGAGGGVVDDEDDESPGAGLAVVSKVCACLYALGRDVYCCGRCAVPSCERVPCCVSE